MFEQQFNTYLGLVSDNIEGENPSEKYHNTSDCVSICIIIFSYICYICIMKFVYVIETNLGILYQLKYKTFEEGSNWFSAYETQCLQIQEFSLSPNSSEAVSFLGTDYSAQLSPTLDEESIYN